MTLSADVYISAGSNIDPVENLRLACRELERAFGALALSSVYRTAAVGFEGPDFLNLVIAFSAGRDWEAVDAELGRIQQMAGRKPGAGFASRTLDLDLLLYGDLVINGVKTTVPRPDITGYAFVLRPLAELAPELKHPVTGATMRELWEQFRREQSAFGEQVTECVGDIHQPMLRPPSTEMI